MKTTIEKQILVNLETYQKQLSKMAQKKSERKRKKANGITIVTPISKKWEVFPLHHSILQHQLDVYNSTQF